jgi:hypothetical protein
METKTLKIMKIFSLIIFMAFVSGCSLDQKKNLQIMAAAAAVDIEVSDSLPIGGWITPRYTSGSDAPIRVQVIVISDGNTKVCMGSCDVTNLHRDILDEIGREVEAKYGIPFNNFMLGATHSHGSPVQTSWSDKTADQTFNLAIKKAVIEAIGLANNKLNNAGEMDCYFALGNATIGQNSRLIMDDSSILWVPTIYKFGYNRPTGPYDPELPVLAFKDKQGKLETIVFNHSTHNINMPNPVPSRSPSFYGTASQDIEKEFGGTVVFLPGAEGSTHVFDDCPTSERVYRVEEGIKKAYSKADKKEIDRLASVKREFEFTIMTFNEEEQDKAVSDYCNRWLKESIFWHADPEPIIQSFRNGRSKIASLQGKTQKSWLQVIQIGDIAFVGVPGELFAELGMEIKRRSPFRYTYIVGIANDYIGYLPDDEAFDLGGYQTWATRSYSERGTGESIVNQAVEILDSLYAK